MSSYSDMEQGELSASPDLQDSPGVRLGEETDEEEEEEEEEPRLSRRHEGDDDDDALDIKPPQTHAGRKERHKHGKHRDERKRDPGGEDSRSRDRSEDRYKEKSRSRKSSKDREVEDKRRQKSLRERERLERLERERYRLEREAARQEREHQERLRAAEREKERERAERDKERERAERQRRKEDAAHDRHRRIQEEDRREKSRDKRGSRDRSRSPRTKRRDRDQERLRLHRQHDDDSRRRQREPPQELLKADKLEDDDVVMIEEPEAPVAHKREDVDIQSPSGEEDRSEESSVSDSQSPSGSEHNVHSDQQEGDSEHEPPPPRRDSSGKFRSKFDDGSTDVESDQIGDSGSEVNDDDANYLDETPPQSPLELKPELPPYYPALQGCRNVEEFHCLNKIEEGTYGVVFRARDKKADEIVALKKLKMEKEKEGFPITSLREINTLLKAQHPNIVTVREIVVGSNIDKIYIVMDYVEHDLKSLMETMKEPFMIGEVKTLMKQLLRGVGHLHDNWIIHRDLKTSNLLLSHKGILKIGDFGLAREYGSPLKQYTPIVVTLWYRAPELLLGCKLYSVAIDMWSVGCIFAELLNRKPLFPGKSELDELNRIFKELGTPNEKIWPGLSELPGMKKCSFAEHPYNQLRNKFGSSLSDKGFDLMNRFLTYDPTRRISAETALTHEYFEQEPLPVPPSMFPTWPAKSEMPRRSHGNSPKPPSGGKAYAKLLGDDDDIRGFHLSGATKGAAAIGHGFALKF